MSSQYLPFEVLEKGKKKPSPYLAQLQIREFKMYEVVCPKECEDKVMSLLKPNDFWGDSSRFKKPLNWLRRLLKLKKCSTNWKPGVIPSTDGMQIIAIGTKDDQINWTPKKRRDVYNIGTPQEKL